MSSGLDQLQRNIAFLRALSEPEFRQDVAKVASRLVKEAIRAQVAKGLDPDGKPWPPRKDGKPALQGVENAIEGYALADVVQIVLSGGAVYSHNGKGKMERRVLPDGGAGFPPYVTHAIDRAITIVMGRRLARL